MTGKRMLALLCALVLLVFTVSGCSKANQADTDVVNAALDKFRACQSFSIFQLTQTKELITMDNIEYVYNARNEKEVRIITGDEAQMMTSATTVVENDGDVMEQSMISYILPEAGGYAEYYSDGTEWYKITTEYADALAGVGADTMIASFYTDFISFYKAGEDTIDGAKTLRYEGALSGENLIIMLETSGYLNNISSMSENQQEKIKKNLLKDLDEAIVTIWVDEASGYPVRFEASMSDVLKEMEESIAKTLGNKQSDSQWTVAEYSISMSVKDFDAVEKLVLPPEAASAQLYVPETGTAS